MNLQKHAIFSACLHRNKTNAKVMYPYQQKTGSFMKEKRQYTVRGNESKWVRPLRDFIVSLDPVQQERFAEAAGTTMGMVRMMMYGNRGISGVHAVNMYLAQKKLFPNAKCSFKMTDMIPSDTVDWDEFHRQYGKELRSLKQEKAAA